MNKEELLKIYSAYLPYKLWFYPSDQSDLFNDLYADNFPNSSWTYDLALGENDPDAVRISQSFLVQKDPFLVMENDEIFFGQMESSLGFDVDDVYASEVKPVLFDLSYLTKEIEHEGKTFIPIVEILKKTSLLNLSECKFDVWEDEEKFITVVYVNAENKNGRVIDSMYYDSNIFWHMNNGGSFNPTNPQREPQELLLMMHFNVFNLSEDQFINKATLNK